MAALPPKPYNFDPLRFSPPANDLAEERYRAIELAAYFLAEKRNFARGFEIEDWLAAEAEVNRQFAAKR